MKRNERGEAAEILIAIALLAGLLVLVGLGMWILPTYHVWRKAQDGRAKLAESEFSRQVAVAEAKAKKDSSTLLAEAEVERAKGVAEANKIIGSSLKENEDYLRWLWIEGMKENGANGHVIYIPTEAGLPILEAGRLR